MASFVSNIKYAYFFPPFILVCHISNHDHEDIQYVLVIFTFLGTMFSSLNVTGMYYNSGILEVIKINPSLWLRGVGTFLNS